MFTMTRRALMVAALTGVLMGSFATAAVSRGSPQSAQARRARPVRPDQADWEQIKAAAKLRNMGMARHRTAHFRVFAGSLGLSELATIHPLAPGRCRTALTYLFGNLLDLQNAEPGENFAPLRRFVAREPSIRACAPRRSG
jgi:hypothetical protein